MPINKLILGIQGIFFIFLLVLLLLQVISEIIETCRAHDFTDVILVHEHRGEPDGLTICHLPFGPTAYFGLLNVVRFHLCCFIWGLKWSYLMDLSLNKYTHIFDLVQVCPDPSFICR